MPLSVPLRRTAHMPAQPIVPWTSVSLLRAAWDWLLAETAEPQTMEALKKVRVEVRRPWS
jgi:hypothetical protein